MEDMILDVFDFEQPRKHKLPGFRIIRDLRLTPSRATSTQIGNTLKKMGIERQKRCYLMPPNRMLEFEETQVYNLKGCRRLQGRLQPLRTKGCNNLYNLYTIIIYIVYIALGEVAEACVSGVCCFTQVVVKPLYPLVHMACNLFATLLQPRRLFTNCQ